MIEFEDGKKYYIKWQRKSGIQPYMKNPLEWIAECHSVYDMYTIDLKHIFQVLYFREFSTSNIYGLWDNPSALAKMNFKSLPKHMILEVAEVSNNIDNLNLPSGFMKV